MFAERQIVPHQADNVDSSDENRIYFTLAFCLCFIYTILAVLILYPVMYPSGIAFYATWLSDQHKVFIASKYPSIHCAN